MNGIGFDRAVRIVCGLLLSACSIAGNASAAEIPESVHREYLMGASSVHLPSDSVRIPFSGTDWYGHYRSPYLRAFVNGKGPFTFLFDTGSNVTTVSAKLVKAAGLQLISHVPGHHAIVRANEIRVEGVSMRDYYVVVSDGDDVDGIFGFNAFGHNYLTFDFSNRALIVSSGLFPLPSAFWMPYVLRKRLPLIDLSADGRTLPTLIDTGDDAYGWEGTSQDFKGLLFDHRPVTAAIVFNGQTGATQTTITSLDGSLALGPVHAERPALAVNEALPLPDIGMDIIDRFNIEFDRMHRRVGFAARFAGTTFTVPGDLTCGFSVSFRQSIRRVRSVLAGFEPARAGMRPGDALHSIGGRPAAHVDFGEFDRLLRARRPISVAWEHDGQVIRRTFPVVELR